jgi:arylsulfatase A-like enzyme
MTEDLDTSVGYILEKLKELGIEKNTYIIYSSDNGSVPIIIPRKNYKRGYNYPLKRGKWDANEGGIRVPFIVTGPEIKAGLQTETPISFSDLLPTIIDLAGGKKIKNKKLDGGSFKQVLLNNNKEIKRNFNGIVFHVPYENRIALGRAHSAIIVDKMKLIKFYDNNETKLFNLKNDMSENENLRIKRKKLGDKLEKKMSDYLSDIKAPKWKDGITWKTNTLGFINSFH